MLLLQRKPVEREVEVDGETVRFKMNRPDRGTAVRIVAGMARVRSDAIPRAAFDLRRVGRQNAKAACDILRARVRELGADPVEIERGAMEPEDMEIALRAWFRDAGHPEPEPDDEESNRRMQAMVEAMGRYREAEARYLESVGDDLLEAAFGLVFDVEGAQTEEGPITTGPDLLAAWPPHALITFVVNSAAELSSLTRSEGKAFGSPSTSEPEGRTNGGTSGVGSADAEDGTGLATAPETPVVVQ